MSPSGNEVGITEIEPGLWIWRARHPFWMKVDDWQPVVTSTFVESQGERAVIDPIAPTLDCIGLWERLDSRPPSMVLTTMPDHVRDVDLFVRRYEAKAYGPMFFFPDDIPRTKITPAIAEVELPGGVIPLYDSRGRLETPFWIPGHKVIVFGDTITEREGDLRIWDSPWHEKREIPALREFLKLPFEKVILSHCDERPVHTRKDFERALDLPPWSD